MRVTLTLVVALALGIVAFQNCSGYKSTFNQKNDSSSNGTDNTPPTILIPLPSSSLTQSVYSGEFVTEQAGIDLGMNITGHVVMERNTVGETRIDVSALGLPATAKITSHVHALPCAAGAGGHYKIDPTVTTTSEANEIWPTIISDANGYGYGSKIVDHIARADAASVVIHGGPKNAIVACADLLPSAPSPSAETGVFALVGTTAGAIPVFGRAILVRKTNGQSEVRTSVSGLKASTLYNSHLHESDCVSALGHYKIDTTIATPMEANEVWPLLTTNANGVAFGDKVVNTIIRTGTHSVVIHDPVTQARYACADFGTAPSPVGGGFLPFEAGLTRAKNIAGSASINRMVNGQTAFSVIVNGLGTATSYMAHVHNRPCSLGSGGGHYKIDNSVSTSVQSNEIWLTLLTDAGGSASTSITVPHVARPDAASIVIHDPTDSAKLGCADLN